jgi:hypothetical protein
LVYDVQHGSSDQLWAQAVLAETGRPKNTLTSATGFTAPGPNEYQSYIVQVSGTNGSALVDPLLRAFAYDVGASWVETIADKPVRRASYPGAGDRASAVYAYGFADTAIVILARRDIDAAEALRQLP